MNFEMKTSVHLIASLILSALLYPLFEWKVLLILISGVLIDVDHYFWYIYKYRKINIFESYKFFIKPMDEKDFKSVMGILLIFHTVEFLTIMIVLSYFNKFILIFTIGLFLHYALDLIYLYFVAERFILNHSIIYWICKKRIQKL